MILPIEKRVVWNNRSFRGHLFLLVGWMLILIDVGFHCFALFDLGSPGTPPSLPLVSRSLRRINYDGGIAGIAAIALFGAITTGETITRSADIGYEADIKHPLWSTRGRQQAYTISVLVDVVRKGSSRSDGYKYYDPQRYGHGLARRDLHSIIIGNKHTVR